MRQHTWSRRNHIMVRPIAQEDVGLKILPEPSIEAADQDIDILAIHGLGAHPVDTWTKEVASAEYVDWLQDKAMLPAVVKNARIMRYGYESAWFGEDAIRTKTAATAKRVLIALLRQRKSCPARPLIIIAHCFGGLLILKMLLDARDEGEDILLKSLRGIAFLGTPFRGAEGLSQVELLAAAREQYSEDQIHGEVLDILGPGNEYLQDLVDRSTKLLARQLTSCKVACFYELKASNVGRIMGGKSSMKFVVSESSGCLDRSTTVEKYPLARTHFEMNKFARPDEEDFLILGDVLRDFAGQ